MGVEIVQQPTETGACVCGIFSVGNSESIMEQSLPVKFKCDTEGDEICQRLCIAMAMSMKDTGPQMICEKLNSHVENLQVAVYWKMCDQTPWKFTGLKSAEVLCCDEGHPTPCRQRAPMMMN
ncbi:PREDICTED: uncharacterized protein LOC107191526 [Dufourea novaeangliae]|uniref:uncharacterized protein LOC107191526 n=1 Tax=Dufourea novaeangliae TaxID=178035 RepID=UPI0007676D88|nr:PREDICTED: uncharacterized protein LOC107191526 [Dufourea novaeangliae]